MVNFTARTMNFLPLLLLISFIAAAGCSGQDETDPGMDYGNAWRIDHAVIVVQNLTESTELFREAGFNVVPGGEHTDNFTHNALIPFKDGSYLELFAATDPSVPAKIQQMITSGTFDTDMAGTDAMQKRFLYHLAEGSGLRDFAVSCPELNISEEQARAEHQGLVLEGPIPMSRTRPDGVVVRWEVAVPVSGYSACVPFLILDNTPRELRVPDGELTSHSNGAAGISSIEIATRDPATVAYWYDTVLAVSPGSKSDNRAMYALNGSAIIIRRAAIDESEGPIQLVLYTDTDEELALEDCLLIY